ncbi:FAD/NAD-binding domain-containing protein [Fomitiporia mediterranea MF3/22]|uniref:FAD/NAD-binding domain-containing protein n=1 Tax=Fomitiporia mediterranea (strain MF3/22) TaxID=694068 RepID=UPI0004407292|nr:FAD/NAD-binding domain-containing protein [Fomitiporia mediterranea MF3/22]EJD07927.1 FAD/NAD-binding domain-containing protein [Fomitiporia mediterranea MF3/22]
MHSVCSRSLVAAARRTARPTSSALLGRKSLQLRSRNFSSSLRLLADARPITASTTAPPTPPPPQTNGNGNGKNTKWRSFLQTVGRITVVTLVTTTGIFVYLARKDKHPGEQLPFDESKKTVVVLGSGWGATSFIRSLDTEDYNVIVVSPKNYFLFTPLLPSVAVGTISPRSIVQPTRYITRHKKRIVSVVEADAQDVDPVKKTVKVSDTSEIRGKISTREIPYDYLVVSVGAEVQTFGIPGVKEHACFMKELHDAEEAQRRFMDCMETAAFPGQSPEEIARLLHVVVVGGGPTGVELSGELHDFLEDDLRAWYPELAGNVRITLVEALPSVLPMFSKQLIDYTESTFKDAKIDILTKTMVKGVKEQTVLLQMPDKTLQEMPYGMLVWAGGNKARKVSLDLMAKFPEAQTNKRGLSIDDYLVMKGSKGDIFAIGDCTASAYAPTAQVASQQGAYLARAFKQMAKRDTLEAQLSEVKARAQAEEGAEEVTRMEKQLEKAKKIRPFHYSHQGSLAYIGSEKAIADLSFFNGNIASGGVATYLFWRSVYLSTLFSLRNRALVANDWLKVTLFGRDVSRD